MNLQEAITALEQAVGEVAKAALSDDKTPLLNALALRQEASSVGVGEENPNVVVFGDLNRFKGLNDQFGHIVGDAAISYVGQMVNELLVKGCQAKGFRPSGDEFVLLLSNHSLAKFKSLVASFASCSFEFNGETRTTAMSFGYVLAAGNYTFDDLLSRAETACLVAKSQGDGACVEWSVEIEREVVDNLRDRCSHCNATITCKVSRQAAPKDGKMLCCPCCGKSLISDNSPA
jgi:diguanylate cyclase (GGDEF)-like protein